MTSTLSKRTTFTTISPLPPDLTRRAVIDFLHSHAEMIDLNPLVIERHPIPPPEHAPDEERRCAWWSISDRISYLPNGKLSSSLTYSAAFNDLPNGVQTHCYAPIGTHIRERWTLNGTLPGEPPEPTEIGIGAPAQGLYLREDVDITCNFMMASFVKSTIKKAHGTLVERLCRKAQQLASSSSNGSAHLSIISHLTSTSSTTTPASNPSSRTPSPSPPVRKPVAGGSGHPTTAHMPNDGERREETDNDARKSHRYEMSDPNPNSHSNPNDASLVPRPLRVGWQQTQGRQLSPQQQQQQRKQQQQHHIPHPLHSNPQGAPNGNGRYSGYNHNPHHRNNSHAAELE